MARLPRYGSNIKALRAALRLDGNPDNEPLNEYGIYSTHTTRKARPQIYVTKNGRWATAQVSKAPNRWLLIPLVKGLPPDA